MSRESAFHFMMGVMATLLILGLVSALTGCSGDEESSRSRPPVVTHRLPDAGPTPLDWCVPSGSMSWADVAQNLNVKVAFVGPVTDVQQEDGGARLLIGRPDAGDQEPVEVVLTKRMLSTAKADPGTLFHGETVCVRGVPERIQGELQVVVNSQNDISVY